MAAENKFVGEGRIESLRGREVILLEAGERGVMSPGGILFWAKCRRVGGFVGDKEQSSLNLVMPTPIKAKDPFLRIRKKIEP